MIEELVLPKNIIVKNNLKIFVIYSKDLSYYNTELKHYDYPTCIFDNSKLVNRPGTYTLINKVSSNEYICIKCKTKFKITRFISELNSFTLEPLAIVEII